MTAHPQTATPSSSESIAKLFAGPMSDWAKLPQKLDEQERILMDSYCPDRSSAILSVGCGVGRELFCFHEMGYRHLAGIDCTPEFISQAREQASTRKIDMRLELGASTKMPFDSETFDLTVLFQNVYALFTPRSARIESLREIRRCLKPGGKIILEATSLHTVLRYRFAFRLMELGRLAYNPCRLERGDKLVKEAGQVENLPPEKLPRSHWFRPYEIDQEANEAGLRVVLASTVAAVLRDPFKSSRRLHRQGRVVYVLEK
jgi:SAM-dependent methyltransferase